MATLTLTVLPAKALKDGRHKVRIAVAHNSTTRYIITDVTLDSLSEWKNGRVVKRGDANYLNTKLQTAVSAAQKEIDGLPYVEGLSCAELIEAMKQQRASRMRTMRSAFEEMLDVATCKDSTKRVYREFFQQITRTIPETTVVANITPLMVRRYMSDALKVNSPGTVASAMTFFTTLLRYCQRNGYTEFKTLPTDGIQKPKKPIRQNWLSPDEVRRLRDLHGMTGCDTLFRDLFMLSYYLGGINLIDLAKVNFSECGGHIKYVRTKTDRIEKANPFVEFDIPEVAFPIIERLKGTDGHLNLWRTSVKTLCVIYGNYARAFRRRHGYAGLTYYSARKSFAQHAFNLGISESVIDYILGHSLGNSKSCLYSYIKVTPAMATDAVRKVCDFIAGTENFD